MGVACTGEPPPLDAAVAGVADPADAVTDEAAETFVTVTDGVLTLCTHVPLPPFAVEEQGSATGYGGFDVDLVAEIASRLGVGLVVEPVVFDEIVSGAVFTDERCDLAAAALTVTDEWARHLGFSAPYYEVKRSLVVLEGSTLDRLEASVGLRVGIQTGMSARASIERHAPADVAVVAFDNTTDLLAALDTGAIDAVVHDLPASTAWVQADIGVAVRETFVTDDVYDLAVSPGRDDALLRLLDEKLAAIREDGTRARLLEEHLAVPDDRVNTGG